MVHGSKKEEAPKNPIHTTDNFFLGLHLFQQAFYGASFFECEAPDAYASHSLGIVLGSSLCKRPLGNDASSDRPKKFFFLE